MQTGSFPNCPHPCDYEPLTRNFFAALMTTSATTAESRHWSSVVLGKIRSLWSAGSANSGLNQLISGTISNISVSFSLFVLMHDQPLHTTRFELTIFCRVLTKTRFLFCISCISLLVFAILFFVSVCVFVWRILFSNVNIKQFQMTRVAP